MPLAAQANGTPRSAYEELAASLSSFVWSEAREVLYVEQINSWRGVVDSKHAQYEEAYSQGGRRSSKSSQPPSRRTSSDTATIYELQCELDDAVWVYDNAAADLDALRTA